VIKKLNPDEIINLIILFAIALFVTWYLLDAYNINASVENLILIGPVGLLTLGLCIAEFIRFVKNSENNEKQEKNIRDVVPAMIIFSGYIMSLEYLGFDLGTILFVGIYLRVNGEKSWKWIVVYSILFGILIPYFFSLMLPYPMPMSILPTDY